MLCATALTALLHADGTVESLAMGHPDPILLNGSAPREVPVDRTLLLGVIPPPQVRLTTFRVPRGNRLLFYTDGLIEGRAAPGAADRFGVDGLLDLLAAGPGQGAATLIDQVAARHGSGLPDDVAVVLLTSPRG